MDNEEIKKYKELLVANVITQEEYNQKKEETFQEEILNIHEDMLDVQRSIRNEVRSIHSLIVLSYIIFGILIFFAIIYAQ